MEIIPYLQFLSSVEIKNNSSVIEFKYEPQSYLLGGILSVLAVLGITFLFLLEHIRKIFHKHQE